jgi:hypothetical protein
MIMHLFLQIIQDVSMSQTVLRGPSLFVLAIGDFTLKLCRLSKLDLNCTRVK